MEKLAKIVREKNPQQLRFEYALWTLAIIRELIRRDFGVKLSEVSVGRLMKRLGFTPQRPLYRAWQQNPVLVDQWRSEEYPKIAARAKRENALIFFADESGIRSDYHAGEGLKKFFGEYRLGEIDDKVIREFIRHRLAEDVAPGAIKRQLNIFIRMFNFAKDEKLVRAVPSFKWPKAVKDKLDVEQVRYLSFQEYDRVLACCPDWLKDIVTVTAWTGLRQRNVLELQRNEVDLAQRAIYIGGEQVKNGEDQGKPIPGPAYAVLERRMKVIHISGSSYVLGDENGAPYHKQRVYRHFKKALKKAGIKGFRFHDLRHCYGSWNAQNGVDLLPLSKLLGHKDLRMTKRYSHLNTASLLKAVGPLERSYQNRVTNQSH